MININNKEWINKGISKISFKKFTDIQEKTVPLLLKGQNIIGVAPTGTGKTYCFLFPILNKIDFENTNIQVVIISPTRELARQIYSKFNDFKEFNIKLKIQLAIGGIEFEKIQDRINKSKPQILIATPEKFIDLCNTKLKINLINTIVFDEADMLVDLGFISIFKSIFKILSPNNNLQKIAFSATLHEMLSNQLSIYFKDTKIIDISNDIWKNDKIKHFLIHSKINFSKKETLRLLLENINPYFCIIFCNTVESANEIYKYLVEWDKNVILLHGKLESRRRKNAYKAIQGLKHQFLVATDLASRGLDIEGASHIISWDLHKDDLWYMHRSGRTGRGKYHGESYVFFDNKYLFNITRLKSKGINWENIKIVNDKFEKFDFVLKSKNRKEETEVDKKIQFIIKTSDKTVKPGYKKKLQAKIQKVKQKEKRKRIESSVKKVLVTKYKIENAEKTRVREEESKKRDLAETNKKKYRYKRK